MNFLPKKEALYNRLNEEKRLSTEIQVNNKTNHSVVQENIEVLTNLL